MPKNIAYINYKMLVWARSTTPFETTVDVQERIHVDATKIDLWERGDGYPTVNEAKKLAKLYKLPFASFYLTTPPEIEPRPYIDRRTERGTVYGDVSYQLWSEIGRVIGNREKIMELVDENDEDIIFEEIPSYDRKNSEEELGTAIREYLGVNLPFKNKSAYNQNSFNFYRKILEKKGILVSQITEVSLAEMKGLSVYYDKYPIVAINNKDYDRAKTFSLIHELAHIIRRSSSLCLIDFSERNDAEEKVCDKIAAEVLMPKESFVMVARGAFAKRNIWDEESLNYISDKFGVSPFSVVRRLFELNLISRSMYYRMYEEMEARFKQKQNEIETKNSNRKMIIPYHTKYLNKEGYLFTKTIINSYTKGKISYGEMCHTLNVSSAHINKMERAVMFV